jgi:protease I
MAENIAGTRVAFVVDNEGVEQVELTEPWKAVQDAGGTPELLAPTRDDVQAFNHADKGDTFTVDHLVGEADPANYDALVLPGGVVNADNIRADAHAVHFVRHFVEADKPIAVICHGPWILIEAAALQGRAITSWPSLKTDVTNAGGKWVDEEVRVDGNLTSSRKPDDLPAFCRTFLQELARRQPARASS